MDWPRTPQYLHVWGEQHVGWLHIAVNEFVAVEVLQPSAYANEYLHQCACRDGFLCMPWQILGRRPDRINAGIDADTFPHHWPFLPHDFIQYRYLVLDWLHLPWIVLYRIISSHIWPFDVRSRYILFYFVSCHVVSCHVMPCRVVSLFFMFIWTVPCHAVPYHVISCRAMSYHAN